MCWKLQKTNFFSNKISLSHNYRIMFICIHKNIRLPSGLHDIKSMSPTTRASNCLLIKILYTLFTCHISAETQMHVANGKLILHHLYLLIFLYWSWPSCNTYYQCWFNYSQCIWVLPDIIPIINADLINY